MSRTARLLELMIRVRDRPRFTVDDMAREFEVSRRTMLRDLQALSAMGVPLSAVPGPGGGYSLIASARMPPLSLSVDEAIGIVLSYESFLQYADSPFAEQSISAITKLRNAMPPDVVRQLDELRAHIAVLGQERTYRAPFLGTLLAAAMDHVHLRMATSREPAPRSGWSFQSGSTPRRGIGTLPATTMTAAKWWGYGPTASVGGVRRRAETSDRSHLARLPRHLSVRRA